VGADRRGPLAAFVVVALIAAILLITSVRSQAAPWFSTRIVAGPAMEPHVWRSVTGGVHQVVKDGAVLVRKAARTPDSESTGTVAAGPASGVAGSRTPSVSRSHHVARTAHLGTSEHQRPAQKPGRPARERPGTDPAEAPTKPGHGRHLGWTRHHDEAAPGDSSDPGGGLDQGDSDESSHPGNGNSNAHGHSSGHSDGHSNGHSNANGWDRGGGRGSGDDAGDGRDHGRGDAWGHGWGHAWGQGRGHGWGHGGH
jgi:hypothetical protein